MNEPDYSIPLLLQDPRVVGQRHAEYDRLAEIEARRANVLHIALSIADLGYADVRTMLSLQLAVEMLRNAERGS